MGLFIYTDAGTTKQADYTATKALIETKYERNNSVDGIYDNETGYTVFGSSPQGGLAVAYLGINVTPMVTTEIDTNNVYIKIFPKLTGPGAALQAPVVRKLYQNVDWAIVDSQNINVNVSAVGANADVAPYVGQGDLICISPKDRGVIGITGNVGTVVSNNVAMYINRVAESGQQYNYGYLQLYSQDTFTRPPEVYAKNIAAVTKSANTSAKTLTLTVNDAAAFNSNKLAGCMVYWGLSKYSTIVASSADASTLTLTLARVPLTTTALNDAPVDFRICLPDMKTFTGVSFDYMTNAINGNTTNGGATVNGLASTTNIRIGMSVSGTGIAAGTYVSAIPDANSVTLSKNATADGTGVSLTFAGSVGTGFYNLAVGNWTGYAVSHMAGYRGKITGHSDSYIVLGDETYDDATPEDCDLVLTGGLEFAVDNAGSPGTFKSILDVPDIESDTPTKVWVKGYQLVKAKPYISPNYQLVLNGIAFPTT